MNHHRLHWSLLLCCLAAVALAEPVQVAQVYSSWKAGGYSFRGEWDKALKALGATSTGFENTQLGELAGRLNEFDTVVTCSVFNLEHPVDLAQHREPFMAWLKAGGLLLVPDASYGTTLTQGLCALDPSFALGWETASSHQQPSTETRRLHLGSSPGLAQVPDQLLPLAEAAGHWAHLLPQSDAWHSALLDSDDQPTLVWQQVGQGLVVVTSYFSLKGGKKLEFAQSLWHNAHLLRQTLQAGFEVKSLDWGALGPGANTARLEVAPAGEAALPETASFELFRGDTSVAQRELKLTADGVQRTAEWPYRIDQRGPHRLALRLGGVGFERRIEVPETVELFSWHRHLTPDDHSVTVRVSLTPEQPFDAAAHRLRAVAVVGGKETRPLLGPAVSGGIVVPTDGLPVGQGEIRVSLLRGDQQVAQGALPLRLSGDPYVRILPDRSCTVGGKPFFSMGMYIVSWRLPDTEAILTQLREIAAGGFNTVHVGVRSEAEFKAVLAEANRLGLMIIPEGGASHQGIDQFKDDPALLAWNPGDEPDGQGRPPEHMADIVASLKDRDPSRPSYMTLCVPGTYDKYYQAADILAPDPYPIPRAKIGNVAAHVERLQNVVERRKPLWVIPQAFGGYSGWTRPPTPAEERNMTYQALVHGARGLIYYTYWDGGFKMAEHPDLWAMMQRLASEVKELQPLLLAGTPETVLKIGASEQAHVLLKSVGDRHYLLAVNTTDEDLGELTIPLPEAYRGELRGLFGDLSMQVDGKQLQFALPPLAVRVYETR